MAVANYRTSASLRDCRSVCIQVWEPVCGSDGKTYSNACHLDAASCRKGWTIDMVHEGECQDQPECFFVCPHWIKPVCGSDGKTYNTKCDLNRASCLNGYSIDMVHEGGCQDQTDYCRLPPMVGFCEALIPRYYFDGLSGTCKQFIYGGCGGNANNFKTKWECETHCVDNYTPFFI